MFSVINVTEDNGNAKAAPIRVLKENLKSRSVVKLWSVAPGHLFYVIEGDGSLFTCSLYPALSSNVKQTRVPLSSPLIKLISAGCGYVVVVAKGSCLHVLKHTPEESWTPVGTLKLPSGDPVIDVSFSQGRHLLWTRQEEAAISEISCSLWRCTISIEECCVSGVSCLARRLPTHSLYSLAASAVLLPTVPSLTDVFWTFDEPNTFGLSSVSQQLLSGTFEPPLDASAVYRQHIRLWRQKNRPVQVLDVCISQLGNRLYILLRDGILVTIDASNPHPRTVQLEPRVKDPIAFYILGPVIAILGASEVETYNVKSGGQAQHRELIEGKLCGLLPSIGGFWTEMGIYRLCLHDSGQVKDGHVLSTLQSEALMLCSPRTDRITRGVSDATEVQTKLHRILQPLVDCYQKLQEAREALIV